jgi:hypothetical protein
MSTVWRRVATFANYLVHSRNDDLLQVGNHLLQIGMHFLKAGGHPLYFGSHPLPSGW